MAVDPTLQRQIMGCFATGVALITTRYGEGDRIWGMTANSVTSLSLDPSLVLFTVDRRNAIYEYLLMGKCFAVNLLTIHQEAISHRFSMRGPKDFSGLNLTVAETGAPVLADALAFLDCRVIQNMAGGDHDIFIGEIVAGAVHDGQPLLVYRGRYTRLALSGAGALTSGSDMLDEVYDQFGSF